MRLSETGTKTSRFQRFTVVIGSLEQENKENWPKALGKRRYGDSTGRSVAYWDVAAQKEVKLLVLPSGQSASLMANGS